KKAVYIATDPDREGEAIGWHIREKLSKEAKTFHRVVFHEITADALHEAFRHPTELNTNLINSQVARRVLDRLVGYSLSPLLWKKIVRGLSAGRVQSVALRFIVEREKEVAAFIPITTYCVVAKITIGGKTVEAKLEKYKGKKAIFETKEAAEDCINILSGETFHVRTVTKKETKRNPPSPYTTSLLQQDAFNRLRFSSQKTMLLAQRLYEGAEVGGEMVGLITYMRTDSFHVSAKAKHEAKEYVAQTFGPSYLPEHERRYKEKKGAQLAHEAIRPTSIARTPGEIRACVSADEAQLYELIWNRFAATSIREALFENTKIILSSSSAEFVAEGRRVVFDGFLRVWGREEEDTELPVCAASDPALLEGLATTDHTTKPPPRFNDASLVKLMEEKGIGRPSTYAPTIYTLIARNYIRREKVYFIPTDLGVRVSDLLGAHFEEIVNENFTALMEEKLDKVEEGTIEWHTIVRDFYPSFKKRIDQAGVSIKKEVQFSDKKCTQCGASLVIKWSRKGRFLSCAEFPKCKYAESITTGVHCPLCTEGLLIERRNKRGQNFYGCTKFPDCRFTSRSLPEEPGSPQQEQGDKSV
ncbi:MAG: type I DNA topoisomerase, partial [Candidatus Omnitrophica bacterium]|nr:type I DNA topoisomerase [Candidatus Omnitrophota bacterium]